MNLPLEDLEEPTVFELAAIEADAKLNDDWVVAAFEIDDASIDGWSPEEVAA